VCPIKRDAHDAIALFGGRAAMLRALAALNWQTTLRANATSIRRIYQPRILLVPHARSF
jgi:hypothetical protein